MMELIKMVVIAVGYAVLSVSFLFGAWLLLMITRRTKRIDFYRQISQKSTLFKWSDYLLQGILCGTIATGVMIFAGVPLYFNLALIMLIPLSILLSMIRIRFLCISYSAAVLGFTSLLFQGQTVFGTELPDFRIHVPSLIILVGILHVCEGALVFLFGEKEAIPIVSKKSDKIVGGHILHMTWLLPLAILIMQFGGGSYDGVQMPSWWPILNYEGGQSVFYYLLPFVGFMSHHSISFTSTPKKLAQGSGVKTFAYGCFVVFVGMISFEYQVIQYFGILIIALLHEVVFGLETLKERTALPLYSLPEEGVRILHIVEGGIAQRIGMEVGDVIEQIDGIAVRDLHHFVQLLKEAKEGLRVNIRRMSGNNTDLVLEGPFDIRNMGLRVIPEKPMLLYPYEEFRNIGMLSYLSKIHIIRTKK